MQVVADRSNGIFLTFAIGLAALSIPPIVHAIFRFVDDQSLHQTVGLLKDLNILYRNMEALGWQIFDGYFECTNPVFCEQPFEEGVARFDQAVNEVRLI